MLARDVHYAIHEAGLAPESPVEDAAFRDAILGVLAQQIETVDEAWRTGFVAGAKWWEWEKSGATMWQADQERAYQAALEKRARQSQGDGGDQKLP